MLAAATSGRLVEYTDAKGRLALGVVDGVDPKRKRSFGVRDGEPCRTSEFQKERPRGLTRSAQLADAALPALWQGQLADALAELRLAANAG